MIDEIDDLLKHLRGAGLDPIVIDENTRFPVLRRGPIQIEVLHKEDSDFRASTPGEFRLVALLDIHNDVPTSRLTYLEWAYGFTNHITHDWTENPQVVRSWGPCRSSSVGDMFVIDGRFFVVESVGFREVK